MNTHITGIHIPDIKYSMSTRQQFDVKVSIDGAQSICRDPNIFIVATTISVPLNSRCIVVTMVVFINTIKTVLFPCYPPFIHITFCDKVILVHDFHLSAKLYYDG